MSFEPDLDRMADYMAEYDYKQALAGVKKLRQKIEMGEDAFPVCH